MSTDNRRGDMGAGKGADKGAEHERHMAQKPTETDRQRQHEQQGGGGRQQGEARREGSDHRQQGEQPAKGRDQGCDQQGGGKHDPSQGKR